MTMFLESKIHYSLDGVSSFKSIVLLWFNNIPAMDKIFLLVKQADQALQK